MKKLLTLLFLCQAFILIAQSDSKLQVGLKDGTILYPEVLKYKTPTFGETHLLLDKEEKIYPEQIRFYQDHTGYYVFDWIDPYHLERLRRETQGKINMYSRVVNTYNPGMGMPGTPGATMGSFSSTKLEYFQKGSGTLKEVNYDNLRSALADNAESMQRLDKVRSLKKLNTFAYVGGGALLVGGLIHMSNLNKQEGPPPYDTSIKFSPLFFVGAAALAIPLFTGNVRKEKMREAIEIYNR